MFIFFQEAKKSMLLKRELPGGPVFKRDLLTDQITLFRTYVYLHDTGHVYCFIFSICKLPCSIFDIFDITKLEIMSRTTGQLGNEGLL